MTIYDVLQNLSKKVILLKSAFILTKPSKSQTLEKTNSQITGLVSLKRSKGQKILNQRSPPLNQTQRRVQNKHMNLFQVLIWGEAQKFLSQN